MLIAYKKPRGRFFIVGKGGSGPVPPTPSQPDDEIWYTSTDDQVVTPNQPGGIQDADGNALNILSNTYSGGKGVIKLDGDVASFVPVGTYGVFESCTTLASVSLPDSVTNIGKYTFYSCSGLASVIIPDSVTTIGERAFYGCSSLVSVTIGNSVSSFGNAAFQDCNNLASVNYTGTVDQWCEIDFNNNSSNPTYNAKALSINGSLLTEVVISDAVTSIGKYVFYNCENITSVTVGNSVTTIGNGAFSGCSGMTSATIGSSVTSIGSSTFYKCTSLVAIESLPTTAPSISSFTFQNVGQNGVLTVHNADYSTWMSTGNFYLGKYNWTCVGGLTMRSISVNVSNGNGTLSVNGTQVTLDANNDWEGSYADGTQITLQMSTDSGHSMCCWFDQTQQLWPNDGYTSYDNPVTITMGGDYTISTQIDTLCNVTLLGASGQGKVGFDGDTPDYSVTKTGMYPGMCEDIYAYPETGYEFVEWQTSDFSLDSYLDNPSYVCPGSDGTITAVFQQQSFSVSVSSNGNGSVSVNGVSGDYSGTVNYGTQLTIEATPNAGYNFTAWSDGNTASQRTITITGDTTLSATFAIQTFSVSISAGNNGSVTVDNVPGDYSGTVNYGTSMTIEGTGDSGYNFDTWSDGDSTNPRTLTVMSNVTLTASFQAAAPQQPDYFYVENPNNTDINAKIVASENDAPIFNVSYSTDLTTWTTVTLDHYPYSTTMTVPANGKVYMKAITDSWNKLHIYSSSNMSYNVGGNIMSLLYGDNFENMYTFPTGSDANFYKLFSKEYYTGYLTSAADLRLPATTLTINCYMSMFENCTALTQPPALPATTLYMQCYLSMFRGCTSLTTAPALPATTLAQNCYAAMFYGCTSLNDVTIYADDISANYCLNDWLNGVAATGTFHNLGTATYPSGASGIPSGWTEVTQ